MIGRKYAQIGGRRPTRQTLSMDLQQIFPTATASPTSCSGAAHAPATKALPAPAREHAPSSPPAPFPDTGSVSAATAPSAGRSPLSGEQPSLGQTTPDSRPDPNRAYTPDTVYLVHKWRAEGMSVRRVAQILHRSEKSVRAAEQIPLRPGEEAAIRRYFAPFRRRRS